MMALFVSPFRCTSVSGRPALLLAALAACLSFSTQMKASSIVADSGFEAAGGGNVYFVGQTIDGGSWTVTNGSVYIDSQDPYVYDGNNSLNLTLAQPYVPNTVSQTVATTIGQSYLVSFWGNADAANTFSVFENGLLLNGSPKSIANNGFPEATTNSGLFTNYSGTFIANSANTTLSFTSTGNPPIGSQVGSVLIDDVTAQLVPTPEPGSIMLVLTGIAGAGQAVRRRWNSVPTATRS